MKITKQQIMNVERAIRRQEEIEARQGGFSAVHRVHTSKKAYSRHQKHKGSDF